MASMTLEAVIKLNAEELGLLRIALREFKEVSKNALVHTKIEELLKVLESS